MIFNRLNNDLFLLVFVDLAQIRGRLIVSQHQQILIFESPIPGQVDQGQGSLFLVALRQLRGQVNILRVIFLHRLPLKSIPSDRLIELKILIDFLFEFPVPLFQLVVLVLPFLSVWAFPNMLLEDADRPHVDAFRVRVLSESDLLGLHVLHPEKCVSDLD